MNIVSYIWTGFSIPEWDTRYLATEEIEAIKNLLHSLNINHEWLRLPQDWIQWTFAQGVPDNTRILIQEKVSRLLKENPKRKEFTLRWVGVKTIMSTVYTLNEHIQ